MRRVEVGMGRKVILEKLKFQWEEERLYSYIYGWRDKQTTKKTKDKKYKKTERHFAQKCLAKCRQTSTLST